jgi:hypothetical protein
MTLREKSLYHQVHPAKLFTDWSTGLVALYALWQHEWVVALIVMFIPSIVVSLLIVRYVNLEKHKRSAFGQYVSRYMTRSMEAVRLLGYAVMATGAWYQIVWLILFGLLIILFGWLRGIIAQQKRTRQLFEWGVHDNIN